MWRFGSAFICVACIVITESTSTTRNAETTISRSSADETSVDFPPGTIEHVLSSLVIRSFGEWDNGKITVQATFAVPESFSWQLLSTKRGAFNGYTRGNSKYTDTLVTTLLTFDPTADGFMGLSLSIMPQEGRIYVRFDIEALRSAGVMRFNVTETLLDAPNEVIIPAHQAHQARFGVTSPIVRSWPAVGINAVHTYLDTTQSPLEETFKFPYDSYYDESITTPGPFGSRTIHLGSYAERFGGSVNVNLGVKLGVDVGTDNNYVKTLHVAKTVHLISLNPLATSPDLVAFPSYSAPALTENVTFSACIDYVNLYCTAYGNRRPTIRILKEGRALQTYEIGWPGVFTQAVYPVDKSLSSVRGSYTCEATNGEMTISRDIVVS